MKKKEALRGFWNPTTLSFFFKLRIMDNDDDDDDVDPDNFVDAYYDEIIRHRAIARRTNWRMCFKSLSQREIALATSINSSISNYVKFLVALIIITNQLLTVIYMMRRRLLDQNYFRYKLTLLL